MAEQEEQTTKKIRFLPKLGIFFIIIIALILAYMHFLEPKIIMTQEYQIINDTLPDSFNGFKIAHFSDLHFGLTINEKEITSVVNKINETKPDLVVFTGDLFDSYITLSEQNKEFLKEELKKITATIGKYCVMGDSDYLDEEAFKEIMNYAEFNLLENQNIPLFYEGVTPIYLSGSPSMAKGKQDYTKAFTTDLEGTYYQIFLSHEPIAFGNVKTSTNLVLSGHSLGGLIRLPFMGGLIHKNNVGDYMKGKYVYESSTLFVSNGIGTEDYSFRFLNFPSINLYRLYNYE